MGYMELSFLSLSTACYYDLLYGLIQGRRGFFRLKARAIVLSVSGLENNLRDMPYDSKFSYPHHPSKLPCRNRD